ncbi:hypothetical protein NO1_2056, partial [Candidatus Termititenax aidoneus]
VGDALGDPPARAATEKTAAPYFSYNYDTQGKINIVGRESSTEPNAEVIALSEAGEVLGSNTATWKGVYGITIEAGPEIVYLQAKSPNKTPSDLTPVPLTVGI